MPKLILLLFSAVALWSVARLARQSGADGSRRLNPEHVGLGAALLIAGLALSNGATGAATLFSFTPDSEVYPLVKGRDTTAGKTLGVDEGFMQWVDARVDQGDRILVVCGIGPCTPEGKLQWVGTRLEPRPIVTRYRDADWLILVGANQADTAYKAFALRDIETYADKMLIARPGVRR